MHLILQILITWIAMSILLGLIVGPAIRTADEKELTR